MGKFLIYIRKNKSLHEKIRVFYGKTFGLWWLKELYIRKLGFYNGKKRIKLLSSRGANHIISEQIKSNKPFLLARYGSVEFRNLFNNELDSLCINAGFFPNNKKMLSMFRKEYHRSSKFIDMLGVWNYQNNFLKKAKLLRELPNINYLISIGVMDYNNEWVNALKDKRILVVHPFKKSIEAQYEKRLKLGILPELKSLDVIKAVQTIAGSKDSRFETWFDALEHMKREIDKKSFDIAIIGCGAYGLPLAAYVKSIGKQALHIGGASQLLFGIKGKRWEDMGYKFNKYWISPLKEDRPSNSNKVEGGCYW